MYENLGQCNPQSASFFLDPCTMTNTQRKRLIGRDDEMDRDVLGKYKSRGGIVIAWAEGSSSSICLRPNKFWDRFDSIA